MSSVVRRLPFEERPEEVSVGLERIRIHPYQVIVWVSITTQETMELPSHSPRFPAVLDTGHNLNFSIREQQLSDWARLSRDQLPRRGSSVVNGEVVSLHAASVWIHPNHPGTKDVIADQPPFRLDFREGIDLRSGTNSPRLPLLGLRALARNKLHLVVDAQNRVVDLRSPDWRTKVIGMLK